MGKILLTSETLTTPASGTIEFDGKVPYFSGQDTQRGVMPSMQYYVLTQSIAGSNSTAAQNVLGVGVTLSSNTVYAFNGNFNFFKTAGTTSHTFNFQWGGTATFNRIVTNLINYDGTNGFVTPTRAIEILVMESIGPTAITASNSSAFLTVNIQISGIVSVNSGGTLIPQYSLSAAPGGAYTSSASNYMNIWPIGTADGNPISVGAWA